jgi:peptidoglycan hydrolase-like amidase
MATRGVAAEDILQHYYPTTQLTTWRAVRDSRNP